jgi:uncharacterized membrane protein HdeD (DUF308 family)
VAASIFGLLTLCYPGVSLAVLVLFFGAYALVGGLFTIAAGTFKRRGEPHGVPLVVSGVLSVAIGVITFMMPMLTGLALLFLIAAWAVLTGIAEMATAMRLRKVITGEALLALAGALSVAFGAVAVALYIGAYAVVLGVLLIVLGLRLRGWSRGHLGEGRLRPA